MRFNCRAITKKIFLGQFIFLTVIGVCWMFGMITEFPLPINQATHPTNPTNPSFGLGFNNRNLFQLGDTTLSTMTTTQVQTNTTTSLATQAQTTALATEAPAASKEVVLVPGCIDKPELGTNCTDYGRINNLNIFILSIIPITGLMGVDYCAAGYVFLGFLKAFTLGGCGVWWLLTWILILVHQFDHSENGCCFEKGI